MSEFVPRPGALRYKDADGEWQYANPHDLMFSTVTMSATEYWREHLGWTPIFDDGEGSSVE